jgi:hypothetical protein
MELFVKTTYIILLSNHEDRNFSVRRNVKRHPGDMSSLRTDRTQLEIVSIIRFGYYSIDGSTNAIIWFYFASGDTTLGAANTNKFFAVAWNACKPMCKAHYWLVRWKQFYRNSDVVSRHVLGSDLSRSFDKHHGHEQLRVASDEESLGFWTLPVIQNSEY